MRFSPGKVIHPALKRHFRIGPWVNRWVSCAHLKRNRFHPSSELLEKSSAIFRLGMKRCIQIGMTKIVPIAPVLKDNLIRLADAYHRASGRSLSTIGGLATKTPGFFTKLASDESTSFTVRKYDEIVAWFMSQDWHGTDIPELKNPDHERASHGKEGSKGSRSKKSSSKKVHRKKAA